MKKEVAEYLNAVDKNKGFRDLDRTRLPREDGDFVIDGKRIENFYKVDTGIYCGKEYRELKPMVKIDGVPYYIKPHKCAYSVGDVASTKMYRKIGFKTPPVYTLKKGNEEGVDECFIISQDITTMGKYEFISEEMLMSSKIGFIPHVSSSDFAPVFDERIRSAYLECMTEECLNERMGLSVNDVIRTEVDRHGLNLFYYRKKGSEKYEGIVPIDNEFMRVLHLGVTDRDEFQRVLDTPYSSYTILGDVKTGTYKKRVVEIMDLLQENKLAPAQIVQLKEALSYDLQEAMLEQKDNKFLGEYAQKASDETARLWDYNRDTIGKELGL